MAKKDSEYFIVYHHQSESGVESVKTDCLKSPEELKLKIAEIESRESDFTDNIIGVFEGRTVKFQTKVNVEVELS